MEEDKITYEYLEQKVKSYITNPDDLALIKRAYDYYEVRFGKNPYYVIK